jgi:hypothetical protein
MTIEYLEAEVKEVTISIDWKPSHIRTESTRVGVDEHGRLVLTDMLELATGTRSDQILSGLYPVGQMRPGTEVKVNDHVINFSFEYGPP